MKYLRYLAATLFAAALSASAQTASLTSQSTSLDPAGGNVALTATVNYDGTPGALGWSIALPADWSLVGVSGINVPNISPETGSTGTLEFAYTSVPASRAEFTLLVRYPAGTKAGEAKPTVLVRAAGKLATLTPPPVTLQAPDTSAARKSRN